MNLFSEALGFDGIAAITSANAGAVANVPIVDFN